ncbi:MAG: nucleotidyltransferase family protein [Saprospiraceae bacterium]|nr:nucleotidyltransferase family protein [Saprospiraceae bacterium]
MMILDPDMDEKGIADKKEEPTAQHLTALVLAAGLSKRMGIINKLLLLVDGEPMLQHVIHALIASTIDQIIVVLGHEADQVQTIVPNHPKLSTIINVDYRLGMSTSIKAGVSQLDPATEGCLICLGDMPYLSTSEYNQLLEYASTNSDPGMILRPRFEQMGGHPVFFGKAYFPFLKNLGDRDLGAQVILREHVNSIQYIEMTSDHCLLDIDQ